MPRSSVHTLVARFWAHVDTSGDCWLWTGCRDPQGYGRFSVATGQTERAHRFAYAHAYGPLAPGVCVLHRCDTPPCVRPVHLFAGTQTDNMRDRYLKGRYGGLVIPPLDGVLSPAQIGELHLLWQDPAHPPAYVLAQRYGVSRATIYEVLGIDLAA